MTKSFIFSAIIFLAFSEIYANTPSQQKEQDYVFTFNGQPFAPTIVSLSGNSAHPQPGDVIVVDKLMLTLGSERNCNFITKKEKDNQLFLRLENGQVRPVGVIIRSTYENDRKIVSNPLDELSSQDIGLLWGVYLDEWPKDIEKKMNHLDLNRAFITLTDSTAIGDQHNMPPIPENTQYLCIDERSNMGIKNYDTIKKVTRIRLLLIRAMSIDNFDADMISQNKSIRYLVLNTYGIIHPQSLSGLEQLEWLNLTNIQNLDTLEFAAKLSKLKGLKISGTNIKDLSPVGNLEHLNDIKASSAPIEKLPDRNMPVIQSLEVFSTSLSKSTVDKFAENNPKCRILFRWDEAFQQAVSSATRLRVRSGGTCHRNIAEEKTLWETSNPVAVREFASIIQIDEKQSGFHCLCCGDPSFEFYNGDTLITTLGFHHGRSLRWPGNWPGDGLLTPESAEQLPIWFAKNGFHNLLDDQKAAIETDKQAKQQRNTFLNFYPKSARKFFDVRLSPVDEEAKHKLGEKIAEAFEDPIELAVASCEALGLVDNSWSQTDEDQQLALAAGNTVSGVDFLKALKKISGNTQSKLGAARFFFHEGYNKKIYKSEQIDWCIILAKTVLEQGNDENKIFVLQCLANMENEKITTLLKQVAEGNLGKEINPQNILGQEPGLRTSAYLVLAQQGNLNIISDVKKLLSKYNDGADHAALELCLALLGDVKYLRREHFEIPSFSIGYAAIKAIKKYDGREGMDILIEGGLEHPWYAINEKAFLTIQEITGQSWCKDPEHQRVIQYYPLLKEWWKKNGEAFIKQQRSKLEANKQKTSSIRP